MMKTLAIGFLLVGAAVAQAEASPPAVQIKQGVDSAEERQSLRIFSACVAQARPGWARRTLAYPYLSKAQAIAAAEALRGTDTCLRHKDTEITFRTSGMVASLAEHMLPAALDPAGEARLTRALNILTPRNASEDFALCVAARNPRAARELARSEPGSGAEMRAAESLAAYVPPCSNPGEPLEIDLPSLRALTSVALYQGATARIAARD